MDFDPFVGYSSHQAGPRDPDESLRLLDDAWQVDMHVTLALNLWYPTNEGLV